MGAKHTLVHIYTAEKHSHAETVSEAPKHQEGYAGDKLIQGLTSRKHTMKTPVLYTGGRGMCGVGLKLRTSPHVICC